MIKKRTWIVLIMLVLNSKATALTYHYQFTVKNNGSKNYLQDAHRQGNFYVSFVGLTAKGRIYVRCSPIECLHINTHYTSYKTLHFGDQETANITVHSKNNLGLQRVTIAIATMRLKNKFQDTTSFSAIDFNGNLPSVIMWDTQAPLPSGSYMPVTVYCRSFPYNPPCRRYE